MKKVTPSDRKAAAVQFRAMQETAASGELAAAAVLDPGGVPHYFGPYPNYANSPLPSGGITQVTVDAGGSGYVSPVITITDHCIPG